jgi:signal transduction histidine kinase
MASMMVEKIEDAIWRGEEELFQRVAQILQVRRGGDPMDAAFREAEAQNPIGGRLFILEGGREVVYPDVQRGVPDRRDTAIIARLREEAIRVEGGRGGIHHLLLQEGGEAYSVAYTWLSGGGTASHLVGLQLDWETLHVQFLARALGGAAAGEMSFLAILDQHGKVVYAPYPLEGVQGVAFAPFKEVFPLWKIGVYQRGGLTFEDALRRQVLISGLLIGMLVLVIAWGLGLTYRILRREVEMAQMKADFVAHVSHDLKTPLSLIRMFAETLEMGRIGDESKRQEYYRIITRESERLTQLINNVLDFSRIDAGKRRYHLQPCDVASLVIQTLEAFQFQLDRRGFKVELQLQPDMPEVSLDPEAFCQALGNLIDNAIKYSRGHQVIQVEAKVWDGALRCAVADQGVGIDPAELPKIFEKFYRVGRSETQSTRGSGIGLALVKHIVEAHGGRIAVESTPGEGSTFTMIIPLDPHRRGAA